VWPIDWQLVIVIGCVIAAGFYLAQRLVRRLRLRRGAEESSCGACGSCGEKADGGFVPLESLKKK